MHPVLRILVAGVGLPLVVGPIWGVVQFASAVRIQDGGLAESVGLVGLVVTFIATGIACLNGLVLGAVTPAGRLRRRLLWHGAFYTVGAVGWAVYSARANQAGDFTTLVGSRNYAQFEKGIRPERLPEAWAAALIHADPIAMRICLDQGASSGTWARVDTRLIASEPLVAASELLVKHPYWESGTPEQQARAGECLRLLQEAGFDLDAKCLDAGQTRPIDYATENGLSALGAALRELGVTP